MQPNFDALYRALVTSTADPTNTGRIRVQCPQLAGIAEIRAAEPANPQEPVPPVGSTVWIAFSGGDITKPVYLTNQAVPATVTANTLPTAPYPGQLAFATDIQDLEMWDGSNWQSVVSPWYQYTPTWSGLSVFGTSAVYGSFQVQGRICTVNAILVGGTGTSLGTGSITVSLPFSSAAGQNANQGWIGNGRLNPSGGNAWHPLWCWLQPSVNTCNLFALRSSDLGWVTPGTAGLTWQAGSVMNMTLQYQI